MGDRQRDQDLIQRGREMQPKPPTATVVISQDNSLKAALDSLVEEVPTSWLDSLLTGAEAVIGKPPWGCPDVEKLLRAVKERLRIKANSITQATASASALSQNVPDHSPASLPDSSAVEARARECGEKVAALIESYELPPDANTIAARSLFVTDATSIIAPYINPAGDEVQQALSELREMLPEPPKRFLYVERKAIHVYGAPDELDAKIQIDGEIFVGVTIPEAMQKVREWNNQ